MLQKRIKSLNLYNKTLLPKWGPSLEKLELNKLQYFIRPGLKESTSWDEIPDDIKKTYEKFNFIYRYFYNNIN